jgi:lipopolysaccharide export system protein LptC
MAILSGYPDPAAASQPDPVPPSGNRMRSLQPFVPRRLTHGYSRFVSMMKFLLPAVAVVVILLVVLWPHLATDDLKFRLGFAAVKLGISEEPSMVNPRYVGADKENQPYSVTADLARRLTDGPAVKGAETLELEMPKADLMMKDGTWVVLTAENGVFVRAKQTLNLHGAVNLYHDSGYEFRTDLAEIDLSTGTASGTSPIEGQGPFGHLKAEGFSLANRAKTIYFTGKSKLILYPGAGKNIQ